jgi:hypothetical protein
MNDTPQACMASFIAALIRKDIDAALRLLTDDAPRRPGDFWRAYRA